MTTYYATCARGLERHCAQELHALGAAKIEPGRGGVSFQGNQETLYRANLWLRTAVRILQPILNQTVRSPEQLYDAVRSIRWREFLTPNHTLAVDCNLKNSSMTHSQYAARVVKDAICDQFREATGIRPSVNVERPAVGLNLHLHQDQAILSLDSSWQSLHKRGYRPIQLRAPMNEALAAGLLYEIGYDGRRPLIDPMCGAGTFAIEAAWMALDRAPGLTRKWFCLMGWLDFDQRLWNRLRDEARARSRTKLEQPIYSSDLRADVVTRAQENAGAAGVGHLLRFIQADARKIEPPDGPPGQLLINPPYGERIGQDQNLEELYRDLGQQFKYHWPFWELNVFLPKDVPARAIRMAAYQQVPFFNGTIPCVLRRFQIDPVRRQAPDDGSNADAKSS